MVALVCRNNKSTRYAAPLQSLKHQFQLYLRNYSVLVGRRESLKISEDASQSTDDVQFNIIEPPKEPLVPTSPNRPVLNVMVLFSGLGIGVVLALGIGLLKPTLYTKDDFTEITDIPVIGTVSRVWTNQEIIRRRLEAVTFGLACLCLLGVYGGLVAVEATDFDLVGKVAQIRDRLI